MAVTGDADPVAVEQMLAATLGEPTQVQATLAVIRAVAAGAQKRITADITAAALSATGSSCWPATVPRAAGRTGAAASSAAWPRASAGCNLTTWALIAARPSVSCMIAASMCSSFLAISRLDGSDDTSSQEAPLPPEAPPLPAGCGLSAASDGGVGCDAGGGSGFESGFAVTPVAATAAVAAAAEAARRAARRRA